MSSVLSYKTRVDGYTNNSMVENNKYKNTRKMLETIPNNELPLAMLTNVVSSMSGGKQVVNELCSCVNGWILKSSTNNDKETFVLASKISHFINEINLLEDFKKAYTFEDDKINIWVVIEEATYERTANYMAMAREIFGEYYLNIDLMIYSFDELDEVLEELSDYENYKEY
ncbi:MAG: hypothetical protein ACRC7N_14640 [Clostridium sp.]